MTQRNKAYLAAMLYAIIIGFSFMFVKIAFTAASPIDTLAHRFTVSLLAASLLLLGSRTRLQIAYKDFLAILPLAILYPTLFFSFQAFGLVFTTSSEAGIIHALIPIFTFVLAANLLNEHSTRSQKAFTLLSVIGVIYIFFMKGLALEVTNTKGAILILLSTLSSAFYNILARRLTKRYPLFELTFIMTVIGMITFNIMAITQHIIDQTLVYYFTPFTSPNFVAAILYLGVLSSLGTSLFSNYALSKMEASKMSVFNNLATLITILAGVIVLHEKLQYFHIIGATMIITGVIGTNCFDSKKETMSE